MVIAEKYKIQKKIGSGAFGDIYKAINMENNQEYAVKLEPIKTKFPQLYYEAKLYKIFNGAGK
jgi:serine/threonine protein kinase